MLKGTVRVISSDPPSNCRNARFTKISLSWNLNMIKKKKITKKKKIIIKKKINSLNKQKHGYLNHIWSEKVLTSAAVNWVFTSLHVGS